MNNKINTFKELMDHICYEWGYDKSQELTKLDDETYQIHKTEITPTSLVYKLDHYEITDPNIFTMLELFYLMLTEDLTDEL